MKTKEEQRKENRMKLFEAAIAFKNWLQYGEQPEVHVPAEVQTRVLMRVQNGRPDDEVHFDKVVGIKPAKYYGKYL